MTTQFDVPTRTVADVERARDRRIRELSAVVELGQAEARQRLPNGRPGIPMCVAVYPSGAPVEYGSMLKAAQAIGVCVTAIYTSWRSQRPVRGYQVWPAGQERPPCFPPARRAK